MTPAEAKADYRQEIGEHGETITLRRVGTPNVDVSVRARVIGYKPEELVGSVQEGSRKIIALAEDVESSSFPLPFVERLDVAIVRGVELRILASDDTTRRIAGELIAYELQVRGD